MGVQPKLERLESASALLDLSEEDINDFRISRLPEAGLGVVTVKAGAGMENGLGCCC
jgi:hypothetical protein